VNVVSNVVKALVGALAIASSIGSAGCVIVPQNRRAALADPMMATSSDSLEAHRKAKLYSSREGAAGGDGTTAGGGCACQ
jgi:hypothetical protein